MLLLPLLLFLCSCSSSPPQEANDRKANQTGEYLYRKDDEYFYVPPPAVKKGRDPYPWENGVVGTFPRITKEFFRCKGSNLNQARVDQLNGEAIRYTDCGGAQKHSLPLRDGKEGVYPVLIDLLNYLQAKTGKRVVITCGHRCPEHNTYVDSSPYNQSSKHMIGAEVSFYVQGMESRPEAIVKLLQEFYKGNPKYKDFKGIEEFKRYEKGDTDVSTQPWMNQEIFIKLYTKKEGRNYDNRHPYPYISIQVRYDRDKKEKVVYTWDKAYNQYLRY
jgi:hypothetical protein